MPNWLLKAASFLIPGLWTWMISIGVFHLIPNPLAAKILIEKMCTSIFSRTALYLKKLSA